MMPAARMIVGILSLTLVAGCVEERQAPAGVVAQARPAPQSPLDVPGLKTRLRDTPAMGSLTRLALRNQAEDLLQEFRTHYRSDRETRVTSLRQSYDMMVMKTLCIVQDDDPPLARTIFGSREAIWNVLADPEKIDSVTWPIN